MIFKKGFKRKQFLLLAVLLLAVGVVFVVSRLKDAFADAEPSFTDPTDFVASTVLGGKIEAETVDGEVVYKPVAGADFSALKDGTITAGTNIAFSLPAFKTEYAVTATGNGAGEYKAVKTTYIWSQAEGTDKAALQNKVTSSLKKDQTVGLYAITEEAIINVSAATATDATPSDANSGKDPLELAKAESTTYAVKEVKKLCSLTEQVSQVTALPEYPFYAEYDPAVEGAYSDPLECKESAPDAGQFIYGMVQYSISSATRDSEGNLVPGEPTGYTSTRALGTLMKSKARPDGDYTVLKRYVVKSANGKVTYQIKEADAEESKELKWVITTEKDSLIEFDSPVQLVASNNQALPEMSNNVITAADLDPATVFTAKYQANCATKLTVSRGKENVLAEKGFAKGVDASYDTPMALTDNNGRTAVYYFTISGTTTYGGGKTFEKDPITYAVKATFKDIKPVIESVSIQRQNDTEPTLLLDGNTRVLLGIENAKTEITVKVKNGDPTITETPVTVYYQEDGAEKNCFVMTSKVSEEDGVLTYKGTIESTAEVGGSRAYYVRAVGRTEDFTAARRVAVFIYDDAAPTIRDMAVYQANKDDKVYAIAKDGKVTANKEFSIRIPFVNEKNTNGSYGTALSKVVITPEHAGITATYKALTYVKTDAVDEITPLNGKLELNVSRSDALALRKAGFTEENYKVQVTDAAGNVTVRDFTVNFYEDDIRIESSVVAEKSAETLKETVFGAKDFRVTYTVTTDVKLRDNVSLSVISSRDGIEKITDETASSMKLLSKTVPTEAGEDGRYTYIYVYTLKNYESIRLEDLTFNVTNINGVKQHEGDDIEAVKNDVTSIINIDAKNPVYSIENSENPEETIDVLQTKWYQHLYLNIFYSDDAEGVPETAVSGIDKIEVLNGGASNLVTADGTKDCLEVEIVESATLKGTPVSITVTDKVGNKVSGKYYFHVDKTKPISELSVDGKSASKVDGTVIASDGAADPEIAFTVKDKLTINQFKLKAVFTGRDGKTTEKVVPFEATERTDEDIARITYSEKLSKIFEKAVVEEGFYSITLQPVDKAGNLADVVTTSFIVDNTAPTADIRVADEYVDSKPYLVTEDKLSYKNTLTGVNYNYNKYFANSVRVLNLEVKDLNPKKAGVMVYVTKNDGEPKRVTIPADQWAEMKDANGNVIGITYPLEVKGDGTYKVTVQATDMSGQISAAPEGISQTVEFVIDTTNPRIDISGFSKINGKYLQSTVTLTASVNDRNEDTKDLTIEGTRTDPVTGEVIAIKAYKLPYSEETNEETGVVSKKYTSDTYSEDGYYEFKLTAVDKAGNKSQKEITFTLDNQAPVVDVLILNPMETDKRFNPLVRHYKNEESGKEYDYMGYFSKDITLKFTSTDYNNKENGAGIIIYDEFEGERTNLVLDSDWTKEDGSEATLINTQVISKEGHHRIMIRAYDKSNHASTWKMVTFDIDKTNPVISSITSMPELQAETAETQYLDRAPSFELKVEDTNEDVKDLQVRTSRINEDMTREELPLRRAKYADGVYKAPDNWFSTNGSYEVMFIAVDKAGRKSPAATYRFTVDKTNPLADVIIREENRVNAAKTGSKSSYKNTKTGVSYTYDKYFNQDITVDLSVIDYNIDMSTLKVVDINKSGEETPLETTEWKETVTELNGKKIPTVTSSVKIAKENEGFHKIQLSALDNSGRTVTAPVVVFTMDSTAPVVTLKLNQTANYAEMQKYLAEDAIVKANVSDSNADTNDLTMAYILTEAGKTTANKEIRAKRTFADGAYADGIFTKEGYYVVSYTAIDKAGNKTVNRIGFTVDKSVPIADIVMRDANTSAKFDKEQSAYKNEESGKEYNYGKYFNKDVVLDFSIADYNNKDNAADIQVTDSLNGSLPVNVQLGTWKDGTVNITAGTKRTLPAFTNTAAFKEEGIHKVTITSTDKAGNKATVQTVTFEIDKTAPVIDLSLNNKPFDGHKYLMGDGVTGVKVTDKNKDLNDLFITVKEIPSDRTPVINTSEYTSEGTKTYVNDSRYEISYTAVDLAGNKTSKSMAFTVDKTKPIADITIKNPMDAAKAGSHNNVYNNPDTGNRYNYAQYFNHNVTIQFMIRDYNASDISVTDNGSKILGVSDFKESENGVLTAEATISVASGEETDHEIVLTSTDMSGAEAASRKVNFTLDRRSPSLSASLNGSGFPSGGSETYLATDGMVSVYVEETNKDTEDLVRTAKITQPSASTAVSVANVSEGGENFSTEADYSVEYVATDLAGNASDTYVVNFRVDKTAPSLNIDGVTAGSTSNKNVTVNYNMVEAFYWDMNSATVSVYKKLDGRAETLLRTINYTAGSSNSVTSEQFTEDGEYRFDFVAEDKAGNKANTSFTFILDKTAPVIVLKNVKNYAQANEPVTLEIQITEDFFATNKVVLSGTYKDIDGKSHKVEFDNYSANGGRNSDISQIFEEDGIYDIEVKATDRGSNETTQKIHFTIDQTDPVIGDLSAYIKESTNKFEWDVKTDDLVKDLTVTNITLYIDGVEYDGVSTLADGTHVLRVVAEDELGHKSEAEAPFLLDTKAPNIIITGVDNGAFVEEPVTITIAVQIDEDTLNWVTVNGEKKPITDGKSCTFTVDQPGNYVIEGEAIDAAGNIGKLETYFNYKSKFNWMTAIIGGGAAGVLGIILIILGAKRRKKNSEK